MILPRRRSPPNWCRACNGTGYVFGEIIDVENFARFQCPKCKGTTFYPDVYDFRPSPFLIWVDPKIRIDATLRGMVIHKNGIIELSECIGEFDAKD